MTISDFIIGVIICLVLLVVAYPKYACEEAQSSAEFWKKEYPQNYMKQ